MEEDNANKSYSERVIEESKVDFYSCMQPLHLIFGIITPCISYDGIVKIDDKFFTQDELGKKLEELSKGTKREYSCEVIESDSPEEEKVEGLAIIGKRLRGIDTDFQQTTVNLLKRKTLVECLMNSGQLLKDLRTLGFKNINEGDLYLYSQFYND